MARKIDWMDFAHALDKQRAEMQDALPEGFVCCLTLASYEYGGGRFSVSLWHRDKAQDLRGYGDGNTPAKAMAAAKEDLAKNLAERSKRPRLESAKTLAPASGDETKET